MGFGQGAAGSAGNGFQLLVIIIVELFGVTLGQMIAAISPSIQVGWNFYYAFFRPEPLFRSRSFSTLS